MSVKLKPLSIIILGKGENIDQIIALLLLMISLKSSGKHVGGRHLLIIMRAGIWSQGISTSRTEIEYAKTDVISGSV